MELSCSVYCLVCREYILETSENFVIGAEYNGSMFKPATEDRWSATMFRTVESVKGGDLVCPRCLGPFIGSGGWPPGSLLTEHGVIKPGQESIDTSFNIVHQEGELKGMLMRIVESKPLHTHIQPDVIAVTENQYNKINKLYEESENQEKTTEQEDDTEDIISDKMICPKCGKEYSTKGRGPYWYEKHVEQCNGIIE